MPEPAQGSCAAKCDCPGVSAILSGVSRFGFLGKGRPLYSVATVGHISAEVSAITFLAFIGSLNLMTAFPRFLPRRVEHSADAPVKLYAPPPGWFDRVGDIYVDAAILGACAGWYGGTLWIHVLRGGQQHIHFQDGVLVGFGKAVWVPVENLLVAMARLGLVPVIAASAHSSFRWHLMGMGVPDGISVLVVNGFNLGPLARQASVHQPELPPIKGLLNWVGIEAATTIVNASVTAFLPALVTWRLGDCARRLFLCPVDHRYYGDATADQCVHLDGA